MSYFLPGENKESFSPCLELKLHRGENIFFLRRTSDWVKLPIFCQNFGKESRNFRQIFPKNIWESADHPHGRAFLFNQRAQGQRFANKKKRKSFLPLASSFPESGGTIISRRILKMGAGDSALFYLPLRVPSIAHSGRSGYDERSWMPAGKKKGGAGSGPRNFMLGGGRRALFSTPTD
jgi:hypothetical protein